jgi:hypothetical protein
MTPQTSPKYALFDEARSYLKAGKIVVGIQFAARSDPVLRARSVRNMLVAPSKACLAIPVLRGRVAPNILFITLCPNERIKEVSAALRSFAEKSPVFKRGQKTVETIP